MSDPRLIRALHIIEKLEARLDRSQSTEPVAVIGTACRFPGADSPEQLWELLTEGRSSIGRVPNERWNGPSSIPSGGFLSNVDQFDAHFFHISPREAESLDPQQRLLLELTWEALERALITPSSLRGSSTGVFVAIGATDYSLRRLFAGDKEKVSVYDGTGNEISFAPGRIAYTLGLEGPTLALSTACSSSLMAVHLASQSLRTGECNMAICGGVHLMLEPDHGHFLTASQALSPSGHCRPFDAEADGFVRGEGCGVVLLKRLSDARRDGDRVLGVIASSAVNNDGKSSGFTAPNGKAQEALIKKALKMAELTSDDLGFFECHGTATNLGDPIEVQAMSCALAERTQTLPIGSIKANLGHLEAAAGMASLFKALLILQKDQVPPQIGCQTPNPHIDWKHCPFEISKQGALAKPVVAISGFGMSGTNAHLILKRPQNDLVEQKADKGELGPWVLPLSARTPEALRELAFRYLELEHSGLKLRDVCATAAQYREPLEHRLAIVAQDWPQLVERLQDFLDSGQSFGVWQGLQPATGEPTIAFLFSGQGSETISMGEGLARLSPSFRAKLNTLQSGFPERLKKISSDKSVLHETPYAQPALFCLELALSRLWQEWGVEPNVLFGHSIGEVAAATSVGVFSDKAAVHFVTRLSELLHSLGTESGMTTVWASQQALQQSLPEALDVACENGPSINTIAGPVKALEALEAKLKQQNISFSRLPIQQAVHTHQIDSVIDDITAAAKACELSTPRRKIVTSRSGSLENGEMTQASYWSDQFRQPTLFSTAQETLEQSGVDLFLEIGPQPTLISQCKQSRPHSKARWVASLRPNRTDSESIACALGQLHCAGVDLAWDKIWSERLHEKVELPLYPWQKQRHWIESRRDEPLLQKLAKSGLLSSAELQKVRKALGAEPSSVPVPVYEVQWEQLTATFDTSVKNCLVAGSDSEVRRQWATHLGVNEFCISDPTINDHTKVIYLCSGETDPARLFGSISDVMRSMDKGTLRLVTEAAFEMPGAPTSGHWLQAAVWGFGQTMALEHPQRWGGLLDLPDRSPESWPGFLEGEDQLAVRGQKVYGRRLRSAELHQTQPSLDENKTYLVTGGFGELGLEAAHSLLDFGARRLILLGRNERQSTRLTELRQRSTQVRYALGDVADPKTLMNLGPVHGIIHAAGVTSDGLLLNLTDQDYETVFRCKVDGLRNLLDRFATEKLDFLNIFSSGACLFGNAGQANYCAANGALSSIASKARALGIPATVVHWGAWSVGMAARLSRQLKDRMDRSGFEAFEASDMTCLLAAALNSQRPEMLLAKIDWERFAEAAPNQAARPFFPVEVQTEAESLDPAALVQSEVKKVLNLQPEQRLDPAEGFFKLGLDSLMAAELASSLSISLKREVSTANILDNPNLDALTGYLCPPKEEAEPEDQSESDLERLLEQKFRSVVGHQQT